MRAPPAPKLTPPRGARVVARPRLLRRLDAARASGATWIAGPPGAGKTTLVASWVEARRLPCAWVQLDAGDADAGAFFHFLSLAARRVAPRARLPAFSPEFLPAVGAFARRFFRALAGAAPRPFVLVLDDAHELPAGAPAWEVLREGLPELGASGAVLVSRGDPPPALARQRLGGRLAVLGADELRLSRAEARALAKVRRAGLARAAVDRIHEAAEGWTAGVVLLLDAAADAPEAAAPRRPALLFDYLAGEILDRAPPDARRLLVETAHLPRLPADLATALTGIERAPELLRGLAERGALVAARAGGVFQLHALLREHLLQVAEAELGDDRRAALRRDAGRMLAARGEVDDAAALLAQAGAWDDLEALVAGHAPAAAEEGRFAAVARWVERAPEEVAAARPWLRFWRGAARLASAPPAARGDLEAAYGAFAARGDAAGAYAAWAAVVDSYFFEWQGFAPLDRWIAELERLRARWPEPPPQLADRVTASVFTALLYRRPDHPDLPAWLDRATALATRGDGALARQAAFPVSQACVFLGDVARARALLAATAASAGRGPIARVASCVIEAYLALFLEDPARARARAGVGLAVADELGLHLWDGMLHSVLAHASVLDGDAAAADAHLDRLEQLTDPRSGLASALLRHARSLAAAVRGDERAALAHAEAALEHARTAGVPLPAATSLAACLRARPPGAPEAAAELEALEAAARATRSRAFAQLAGLVRAERALRAGELDAARRHLAPVVEAVREHGGLSNPLALRPELARVCGLALARGVEEDALRRVVRARGLAPSPEAAGVPGWPWPVRVRFADGAEVAIERDGAPVRFGRKVQKKPLQLLRVLAEADGPLRRAEVEEALWPDADGDAAHVALDVTLHRLRRLVGRDDAVVLREGALRLDRAVVFVERR